MTPARSPETVTYAPAGGVPAGEYEAEVCPFDEPTAPFVPPGDYVGVFIASEQEPPDVELAYPPMWDSFVANPALDFDSGVTIDNRLTGCWVTEVDGDPVEGCDNPPSAAEQPRRPSAVGPRHPDPVPDVHH